MSNHPLHRTAQLLALMDHLRAQYGLHEFVETGTLMGHTALWAAAHFEKVWTIELDPDTAFHARANFAAAEVQNVTSMVGDSRECLGEMLAKVVGKALVFLDAHWGPDLHYERPEAGECPLMAELETVARAKDYHVILIHDARLFLEPDTLTGGHDASQWPSWVDILSFAATYEYKMLLLQEVDCILLVPTFISEVMNDSNV